MDDITASSLLARCRQAKSTRYAPAKGADLRWERRVARIEVDRAKLGESGRRQWHSGGVTGSHAATTRRTRGSYVRAPGAVRKGVAGQRAQRLCGAEERRFRGQRAQRASTSDLRHLFERSERSERSELCRGPRDRAPQGSRPQADRRSEAEPAARPRLCALGLREGAARPRL